MFGIKSKKELKSEADLYAEGILSLLSKMIGSMNKPEDQALLEIFGGVYLLYLCRESVDFKHIRPYLADAFLAQTKYFHCGPADRQKRVSYISACFDAYETAEKALLKQKKNLVSGLLDCIAANGLMELLESNPSYPALWKASVNLAISHRKLTSYQPYTYSEGAEAFAAQFTAPAPAPKAAAKRLTLTGPDGKPTEFQIIDTIAYQNETYVCLLNEKRGENLILRVLLKPDGRTAYADPGPVIVDIVMELARKRNPLSSMPGKKDRPRTMTLRNQKGEAVEFEVMDIIPHQGRTFVCLLGESDEMLTILETRDMPGGSASYESVDERTAEIIFELFKKRNPDLVN